MRTLGCTDPQGSEIRGLPHATTQIDRMQLFFVPFSLSTTNSSSTQKIPLISVLSVAGYSWHPSLMQICLPSTPYLLGCPPLEIEKLQSWPADLERPVMRLLRCAEFRLLVRRRSPKRNQLHKIEDCEGSCCDVQARGDEP